MAKVILLPGGRELEGKIGDNLLALSQANNAGINHGCGGIPRCAMCRVVIKSGGEFLSPLEHKEQDIIGTSYWLTRQRLSCQARIISEGTIEVDISEHEEYLKQRDERDRIRAEKAEREKARMQEKKEQRRQEISRASDRGTDRNEETGRKPEPRPEGYENRDRGQDRGKSPEQDGEQNSSQRRGRRGRRRRKNKPAGQSQSQPGQPASGQSPQNQSQQSPSSPGPSSSGPSSPGPSSPDPS